VAQVVARSNRPERVVELVHERNPGRDVQLDDVLVTDPVEVLHERTQAVAVRRDEHALAPPNRGSNVRLPQREKAADGVLQALRTRQLLTRNAGIARVLTRPVFVALVERWRRDVVAAPPDLHLLFS